MTTIELLAGKKLEKYFLMLTKLTIIKDGPDANYCFLGFFLKVLRIPPLAVGIGMYLPQDVTTPVVLGAIIGYMYNRAVEKRENGEMAKRFGVLLACGFIVGESLLGILNAGLIVASDNPAPIAIPGSENLAGFAPYIGLAMFAALLFLSYAWVSRQSRAK